MNDEWISPEMKSELCDVVDTLNRLDDAFFVDGVSQHYLTITQTTEIPEIQVRGNVAGLLLMAKQILKVAMSNNEGNHEHLDESGIVDRCNVPITVTLTKADWD